MRRPELSGEAPPGRPAGAGWTAAILAGGESRRLGKGHKAALQLGGASVLDRQLALLGRVVGRTIIIANDPTVYGDYGVPVVPDLAPHRGALGGLYTAIQAAGTDRTLVIACDMPFLTEPLLSYLVEAGRTVDIAIPRTTRGYEPLCATYSRGSAAELLRRIDEKRFKLSEVALIAGLTIREIASKELERFGPEDVLFFNINTPDDYARAIELDERKE
jgi:molybdopterin-guanine dinucleotide biosynthesis protein A